MTEMRVFTIAVADVFRILQAKKVFSHWNAVMKPPNL